MEEIILNETPVRTSRNFNINNIKLEDIKIPEKIEDFRNVKIINETSKITIEKKIGNCNLVYGLGELLTDQIKEKANQKLQLTLDSKQNKKIEIEFKLDEENPNLLDYIEVIAKENSKAIVIVKYKAEEEVEGYHNGIVKIEASRGAEINIILVNLMNSKSNHFMSIENSLEENAKLKYTIIDFGGRNSITNYYSNLVGDFSENILNTIYLGKENQLLDLNYIGELRGKKSSIDLEVQGALKDKARKHFKGTIDFKKGCKKAKGNENESCMLLSDTAKSLALPMLLCSEEEVEGNHSSSAGKVEEKELFYIMSRGFTAKEAMKLMVRAKFNKILTTIPYKLEKEIMEEIDKRLD